MDQEIFSKKWHRMLVKSKGYYQIPDRLYFVTATLFDHDIDKNESVFAILSDKWSKENPEWYTIMIPNDDIHKLDERFEIIDGPFEHPSTEPRFK